MKPSEQQQQKYREQVDLVRQRIQALAGKANRNVRFRAFVEPKGHAK